MILTRKKGLILPSRFKQRGNFAAFPAGTIAGVFPRASNILILVFNSSASNSEAGFELTNAGKIRELTSVSNFDVGDFARPNPGVPIGDFFEVRTIQSSGDTLTGVNPGLNVFLAITSTRRWSFDDTPGEFKQFVGTYEVREIANPSNTSGTKSVVLNTEDGS